MIYSIKERSTIFLLVAIITAGCTYFSSLAAVGGPTPDSTSSPSKGDSTASPSRWKNYSRLISQGGGETKAPPSNFPIPIYRSKDTGRYRYVEIPATDTQQGRQMLLFDSKDNPASIVTWYKSALTQAGWKLEERLPPEYPSRLSSLKSLTANFASAREDIVWILIIQGEMTSPTHTMVRCDVILRPKGWTPTQPK